MAKNTLPNSVALLKCIADQLQTIDHMFNPLSTEFHRLKGLVKENDSLSEAGHFFGSEHIITYLQCLMLAGLSMKSGVDIPIIKTFNVKQGVVTITWDSQVTDSFTFGSVDEHFIRFLQYYCGKIFGRSGANPIPPCIMTALKKEIAQNYERVLQVKKLVKPLISSKTKLFDFFDNQQNREAFFIVMACLDTDQINALFIHIQQFFPHDLKIKTNNGHLVNVASLFQRSSSDISYLLEKINMYFEIYFSADKPIIREITKSKTSSYMKKQLGNSAVFDATIKNIKNIIDSQVEPRIGLYQLLLRHMSNVDLAKTALPI